MLKIVRSYSVFLICFLSQICRRTHRRAFCQKIQSGILLNLEQNQCTGAGFLFAIHAAAFAIGVFVMEPAFADDATSVTQRPGLVNAWGNNEHGQSDVPSNLKGLGECIQISASASQTAALRSDGTVKLWGYNCLAEFAVPWNLGECREVVAGARHTAAIKKSGAVVCWGDNSFEQCDPPKNIGTCIHVATGDEHTVALKLNGFIRAWGNNANGQTAIPTGGGYKQIIAGNQYSGAIQADGKVVLWGAWITQHLTPCTVPNDLGPCTMIAAGSMHTVAIRSGGSVIAWGSNDNGQCLGTDIDGNTITSTPAGEPVKIMGQVLTGVNQIVAGESFTAALRYDGTISAWGSNLYTQCDVPQELNDKHDCVQLAAGADHLVALQSNGIVTAWGNNNCNQCGSAGYGDIDNSLVGDPYWTKSQLDTNCIAVAAGKQHNVALVTDGTIVCWGDNSDGQCETGTSAVSKRDGQCETGTSAVSVVQIAAGNAHTVVLESSGVIYSWGVGGDHSEVADRNLYSEITAGGFHTAALTMKNAFAFPISNREKEKYNITQMDSEFSYATEIDGRILNRDPATAKPWRANSTNLPSSWLSGIDLTAISIGPKHGVLITPRHMLFTKHFPYSSGSSLGEQIRFLNANNEVKVGIVKKISPIGEWATPGDSIIPEPDLLVVQFENDVDSSITPMKIGVFGYGQTFGNEIPANTPVIVIDQDENALIYETERLSGLQDVLHPPSNSSQRRAYYEGLVVGDSSSPHIILYKNNDVLQPLLVGLTTYGNGTGPNVGAFISEITQNIQAMHDTDAKYKLNIFHNNFPNRGGVVQAWGDNQYGQSSVPANVGPCTQLAAGQYHTVALLADGSVRAWGNNDSGECDVPAELLLPNSCIQITAGGYHSAALRADGSAMAWGRNIFGECNVPENLGKCQRIAAGGDDLNGHTVAMLVDGSVVSWGGNVFGECDIPLEIGTTYHIAAGASHTLAIASGLKCVGDLDGSGVVDSGDIGFILINLDAEGGPADLDESGLVDSADVGMALIHFGESCL